jgi:hypothetical protein
MLSYEDPGRWSVDAVTALLAHCEDDPVLLAIALVSALHTEPGTDAAREVRSFLEREPDLEAALTLFLLLDRALTEIPELLPALSQVRVAVIDRLDRRWQMWRRHLLDLFDEATPEESQRLKERLYLLQDRGDLEARESEVIRNALDQIERWQGNDRRRLEKWAREEGRIPADPDAPREEDQDPEDWEDEDEEQDDIDGDEDDWEDDDEDTKEHPLPDVSLEDLKRLLERLFPPPRLVMKSLEPAPEPLQPQDLQPLLRPLRRQSVEEALRVGLRERCF